MGLGCTPLGDGVAETEAVGVRDPCEVEGVGLNGCVRW